MPVRYAILKCPLEAEKGPGIRSVAILEKDINVAIRERHSVLADRADPLNDHGMHVDKLA